MKSSTTLRVLLLTATILCVAPAFADATTLTNVGSQRQLFIDTAFFDTAFQQPNNVSLQLHQPTKTNQQVVQAQYPWESATLNWFNVVQDQGVIDTQAKYRMWYECYDKAG